MHIDSKPINASAATSFADVLLVAALITAWWWLVGEAGTYAGEESFIGEPPESNIGNCAPTSARS